MPVDVHPSEFAYAFSYAKVEDILGWGLAPFLPAPGADIALGDWTVQGEERLVAAGRLVGTPEQGLNFTDDISSAVLALVNPGIVLMAQRKAGEGMRTLTVHLRGADVIGLTRDADGMFDMTRYDDLTAAAVASAAFVGASLEPSGKEARVETDRETLSGLARMARTGQTDAAQAILVDLGATPADAASVTLAIARPESSGVVSVLYCRNNAVEDAETISVMTNAQDQTWIMFAPASAEGPVILERASVAALAARLAVGVVARLRQKG